MPVQKKTDAVKAEGMKCCEGMEKMGEMKAGHADEKRDEKRHES